MGKTPPVLIVRFDGSRPPAWPFGGETLDLRLPPARHPARKLLNAGLRALRLAALFRRERPARIIAFTESANFAAIVAATVTGQLDRLQISTRVDPATKPPAHRALMPLLYRLPARIVAVSAGVKQGLEAMHIPSKRITVIYNPKASGGGVNTSKIANLPPAPFILGVGRLVPQKGFDLLFPVFHRLGREDLHLAILGEGAERANLEHQARALGIADRVHLPGWVADPAPWYRAAGCFVLSLRYEGFGNVLIEAMANGCPVVAFDCPYGPSEIIEHGMTGLLVPKGDVAALGRTLARLLADDGLRRRLGAAGRQSAALISVEAVAPRWLDGACGRRV